MFTSCSTFLIMSWQYSSICMALRPVRLLEICQEWCRETWSLCILTCGWTKVFIFTIDTTICWSTNHSNCFVRDKHKAKSIVPLLGGYIWRFDDASFQSFTIVFLALFSLWSLLDQTVCSFPEKIWIDRYILSLTDTTHRQWCRAKTFLHFKLPGGKSFF